MTPHGQLELLMPDDLRSLRAAFDNVDVEHAECVSAAAERVIHANIRQRYGTLAALTNGAATGRRGARKKGSLLGWQL